MNGQVYSIYKLFSTSCDLVYVGMTSNSLATRRSQHLTQTNRTRSRFVVEASLSNDDVKIECIAATFDMDSAKRVENSFIDAYSNVGQKLSRMETDRRKLWRDNFKRWLDKGSNRDIWNAYRRGRYAEATARLAAGAGTAPTRR